MTFLNPLVLLGLMAAALPILIHLFNKRKLRTIDFSTLTFLKELQKNTIRKITIRQWILLILRTLLIIFLVLAFSRPALKGTFGTIGSHATSTVVIILDNTPSMDRRDERGRFLDQAKEQALRITGLLQNNDDAAVIRLSDIPSPTIPVPTHDRQHLASVIQETEISQKHRTITDALRIASTVVQESKNANKEIFVLTDGQTSTFTHAPINAGGPERIFPNNVHFFLSMGSAKPLNNAGIESVSIPPTLLQKNKPFTVNAVIKNYGSTRFVNHLVSISIGTTRVMQKSITLEPEESGTVGFSVTPSGTGFIGGSIDLEDDAFEADNSRYFSLTIPDRISVTLVAPDDSHPKYLETALAVANTLSSSGMIGVQRITPSQISTSILASSDVVVFSGVQDLPETQNTIIRSYVLNGGNLVFFPSSDSATVRYSFLRPFDISIAGITKAPQQTNFRFTGTDLDFPIFTGMFDNQTEKSKTLESPSVSVALRYAPTKSMRTIISLSDGTPFLWLREMQKGKILGFSVPANSLWSDFPLKGIFVPIVYQSLLYLSSQEQLKMLTTKRLVGEQAEFTSSQLRKSKQTATSPLRLLDPENRPSPLQSYAKSNADGVVQTIYTGSEMQSKGQYYVENNRDTLAILSVNIDVAESDNTTISHKSAAAALAALGVNETEIRFIASDASIRETVQQNRFGVELWRYCALMAVLFGLIEMIIAREKKES